MSIQPSSKQNSSDILSNLPDSILFHILSFLTTAESVTTSILSTKWKHHWTNLPTLKFYNTLAPSYCDDFGRDSDISRNIKFAGFVNRVLHFHRENPLIKFSLHCHLNSEPYDIGTWISISIMKGVRNISLSVSEGEPVRLPSCFFNSTALEVIKLLGQIRIKAPSVVYLPNLKKMKLYYVDYEDGESANKLISSCRSLDYLDIGWNGQENFDTYIISSSTLRFLRYHANDFVDFMNFPEVGLPVNPSEYIRSCLGCKTLEVLHLSGMTIKGAFSLPNLRVLTLDDVKFGNDESASNLITSFPSLESLVIVYPIDISKLKISSSTLRDLKVNAAYNKGAAHVELVLDAPALQHLHLDDWELEDVHIKNLPSLIDVVISLQFRQLIQDRCFNDSMCTIFHGLCNVEILSLSWWFRRGGRLCQFFSFTIPEHKFPQFPNLAVLRMELECSSLPLLQQFIKNSNALEDLIVYGKDLDEFPNCRHSLFWKDPEIVPECLLSRFRRLHFYGFQGFEHELAMVEYFLKNSRVMRRMVIEFFPTLDNDNKMNLHQKLLKFYRASKECEITVCSDGSISSQRNRWLTFFR